jgi:hypothetical protein
MMEISTNTLDSARPFRIFVSLLDRWEVGYPLSMALVYDALNVAMEVDQNGSVEEVVKENVRCFDSEREKSILKLTDWLLQARMAARAVYEGVEPYIFWSIIHEKLQLTDESREADVVSYEAYEILLLHLIDDASPFQMSALNITIWVLNTFRIQDEEVTRVHLPLILHLLVTVRTCQIACDDNEADVWLSGS